MLTTILPNFEELRVPLNTDGKYYVELFSYGQVNPIGHALQTARKYFKGRVNLNVLEIGVLRGHNAENLNRELTPELLVLVDPWELAPGCLEYHDNNWAETYYRIQGQQNIIVIKATSEVACGLLSLNFDYIYIDGDHGDIENDLHLWHPCMNKGGIIAGHDYNYPNIKKAVHDFFGSGVDTSPYHPHGGMDWWVFT